MLLTISFRKSISQEYLITRFGAVGDGKTMNTYSIQRAIDSCHVTGGYVIVPSDTFMTGTIRLKSNVTLHLEHGAVLKGSPYLDDYPFYETSPLFGYDGTKLRSLIHADGAQNIGITGYGTINGNVKNPELDLSDKSRAVCPIVVRFINCAGILIENLNLLNSPRWMQEYIACRELTIHNLYVYNHGNQNNDGLDIIGCNQVKISDCHISSDDDGICLKTISDIPNENISLTNCLVQSNCSAIRIGKETRADHRNIVITNCIVSKTGIFSKIWNRDTGDCGLALETADGGTLENIVISDLVVTGVYTPLFIRLGNRGDKYMESDPIPPVGIIRDVKISNFNGRSERPPESSITGIPGHFIENLELTNVTISGPGSGDHDLLDLVIPEQEDQTPDVRMFGTQLPAYGLYIRHVKNISIRDISFFFTEPDLRPAIYIDDADGGVINGYKSEAAEGSDCQVRLINVRNIRFMNCVAHPDARAFMDIQGKSSKTIILKGNVITGTVKPYTLGPGLNNNVVKMEFQ